MITIPNHKHEGEQYPGNIKPGSYTERQFRTLIIQHRNNDNALLFLADKIETGTGGPEDEIASILRSPSIRRRFIKNLVIDAMIGSTSTSLNEEFTIANKGNFNRDQIQQLLIQHKNNENLLDDIISNLKTTDPEEELFVSGMQKLINNPQALQMVINYFVKKKSRSQQYKGYAYLSKKKKQRIQQYQNANLGSIV